MFCPTRDNKGLTLIELQVVVAILGVQAAVVTLNICNFIGWGKTQVAAMELYNVQTVGTSYQANNNGIFPTDARFPVASQMNQYFVGGVAKLHGTYT